MSKVLRRYATVLDCQLREDSDSGIQLDGIAAVFDSPTLIGGREWGFVESIAPGAFDDVLGDDVRMLLNHDSNYLLARTTSGTLTLSTTDAGLRAQADLAPVSYARDLKALIQRGDLNQMSFSFTPDTYTVGSIQMDGETYDHITITRVGALYDVSPVTFPAYKDTSVSLRSEYPDSIAPDDSELREMELRAIEIRPAPRGLHQ